MKISIRRAIKFIAVVIMVIVIHNFLDPPDWVELDVLHVPPEVDAFFVLANDEQGGTPLNWYFAKVTPFTAPPLRGGEEWNWNAEGNSRRGDVQWRSAASYGILAKKKNGEWVVWWLQPSDLVRPTRLRYLIGGHVKATIKADGIDRAMPAPKSLIEKWQ